MSQSPGGRASQSCPMSPIGAPGGAGDGGTMAAQGIDHRPLEEALDVGGDQGAMRPFGFRPAVARRAQPRREPIQLE